MGKIYPLFFEPVYKNYVWGGRHLANYGRNLPKTGVVAESWEISSHEDGMTRVKNGFYAGATLQDVLDDLGIDLVGDNNRWALNRGKFPLLVKVWIVQLPEVVMVPPEPMLIPCPRSVIHHHPAHTLHYLQ